MSGRLKRDLEIQMFEFKMNILLVKYPEKSLPNTYPTLQIIPLSPDTEFSHHQMTDFSSFFRKQLFLEFSEFLMDGYKSGCHNSTAIQGVIKNSGATLWYQLVLIRSDFEQLPLQSCCEHLDGSIFMIYANATSSIIKLSYEP